MSWATGCGAGPCYRFGDFELDCEAFMLTWAGRKRHIGPKVFDVLRHLVEHRARLVTKQELLDVFWADQCVEEAAVAWAVSHARRALRQRASRKSPIETIYGRGYRFNADVQVVSSSDRHEAPTMGVLSVTGAGQGADYALLTHVAQRAGLAAARANSYADAARFYGWALEAQAHDGSASAPARAELLLSFARAQGLAGAGQGIRFTVAQLIELSLRHGYRDVLVQAAQTLSTSEVASAVDMQVRRALETALETLPS